MKKISTCVLFLMLCFMTGVAQNKKEHIALLPPLNLVAEKNCVDVNPEFYFNNNPELQGLIMDFKRVLKNSFIPVAFDVTSNGIVESATVFKPLLPKGVFKNKEVELNTFFGQFVGLKIIKKVANKNGVAVSFKTVLSLLVIDNQITLNPIIH